MHDVSRANIEFVDVDMSGVIARILCAKGGVWYDGMRPVTALVIKISSKMSAECGRRLGCDWKIEANTSEMKHRNHNSKITPEVRDHFSSNAFGQGEGIPDTSFRGPDHQKSLPISIPARCRWNVSTKSSNDHLVLLCSFSENPQNDLPGKGGEDSRVLAHRGGF